MIRNKSLAHRFVEFLPTDLQPGILYISIPYATAAHRCCCGCGEEVVTPFTPTDWKMTFDGESVSLWPSIGNWTLNCRSHYVIAHGRVVGAGRWSDRQIAEARRRDHAAKARHYGTGLTNASDVHPVASTDSVPPTLWRRVWRWATRDDGE
jgi:hypothetical protein